MGKARQLGLHPWCVASCIPMGQRSEHSALGRSRASLQTSSCIPGALGPPTITRRFHNLPRKHHYLATEFKRMSLLETVHIQTTAEGHALGETGGSLATDPKKQVGRRTKRKYPSHSRVTTVGNNSLLIL